MENNSINETVQRDLAVGRHITAGGSVTVTNKLVVGGNAVVEGWLDARNLRVPCKGLFADETTLVKSFPRPLPGWWALVGDGFPADVYRVENGVWVGTGETYEPSIYLDDLESDVSELKDRATTIEVLLATGIIVPGTLKYSADGSSVTFSYTVNQLDGTVVAYEASLPVATTSSAGVMSAEDKVALDGAVEDITEMKEDITELQGKIYPSIAIEDLDFDAETVKTYMAVTVKNNMPLHFKVTQGSLMRIVVGSLEVVGSSFAAASLTQLLTTGFLLNDDGTLNTETSYMGFPYHYKRIYNLQVDPEIEGVAIGEWGAWEEDVRCCCEPIERKEIIGMLQDVINRDDGCDGDSCSCEPIDDDTIKDVFGQVIDSDNDSDSDSDSDSNSCSCEPIDTEDIDSLF